MRLSFGNALSYGSEIVNNSILNDITNYPVYVRIPNFYLNSAYNTHFDNHTELKYVEGSNVSPSQTNQITYLIYCNSDILSETVCNQAIRQMYIKGVVNGHNEYGTAGRYNCMVEKIGSNIDSSYGKVEKEWENENTKLTSPFISPITLVKNHSEITGNGTLGLQLTIQQQGTNGFPYRTILDMFTTSEANKFITVKKLSVPKKVGNGEPSGNPSYIGEVYFNTNNRRWYVGDTLTSWKQTDIIQ